MSESRVRENRTHGSIGGRWPSETNRNDETTRKPPPSVAITGKYQQPAAYLTELNG